MEFWAEKDLWKLLSMLGIMYLLIQDIVVYFLECENEYGS